MAGIVGANAFSDWGLSNRQSAAVSRYMSTEMRYESERRGRVDGIGFSFSRWWQIKRLFFRGIENYESPWGNFNRNNHSTVSLLLSLLMSAKKYSFMKITQHIEFYYGANGNEHVKETKRRPNIRQLRLNFANSTEKFQPIKP